MTHYDNDSHISFSLRLCGEYFATRHSLLDTQIKETEK